MTKEKEPQRPSDIFPWLKATEHRRMTCPHCGGRSVKITGWRTRQLICADCRARSPRVQIDERGADHAYLLICDYWTDIQIVRKERTPPSGPHAGSAVQPPRLGRIGL